MLKQEIQQQIESFLKERNDLFLISFTLSPTNDAELVLDGDLGVSIEDCVALTRQIEHNVDREKEDYSLRVGSYGLSNPLINERQYQKNIGKKVKIQPIEGKEIKGTIESVKPDSVIVSWKERVPKKIGKGKTTERFQEKIPFKDIQKANIIVTF